MSNNNDSITTKILYTVSNMQDFKINWFLKEKQKEWCNLTLHMGQTKAV